MNNLNPTDIYPLLPAYIRGYDTATLHGVLEDGNLEDITLDFQIRDLTAALKVLTALRTLTYSQRWDLYERLNAEPDRFGFERRNEPFFNADDIEAAVLRGASYESRIEPLERSQAALLKALSHYTEATFVSDWGMEELTDDGEIARAAIKQAKEVTP